MDFLTREILSNAAYADEQSYQATKSRSLQSSPVNGRYNQITTSSEPKSPCTIADSLWTCQSPDTDTSPTIPSGQSDIQFESTHGNFTCRIHTTTALHVSGQRDRLPFSDGNALLDTFRTLNLPESYLHIADGMPSVAQTIITTDRDGTAQRCDFIAHCNSKHCAWALALRLDSTSTSVDQSKGVSALWTMDERADADSLIHRLRGLNTLAFHPMLLPCIMFAYTTERAVERRNRIKKRLRRLEQAIMSLHQRASQHSAAADAKSHVEWLDRSHEIDSVIQDLHDCKKEQASCQGRYYFWCTFHDAIEQGLAYGLEVFKDDERYALCQELMQWTAVTWRKLGSLQSRDIDLVSRVAEASDMLHHVLQQREAQVQCSIARAALRDSGDMKFIALLGSIFLPAGLIATLLSIPQFQPVDDVKLLLVYIGVTIPLIGVVVFICMTRSKWTRLLGVGRKLSTTIL